MHHLLVYASSVTNGASLANIAGVTDQLFPLFTSNNYTPASNQKILRAYAMGDSITQIRLDSPLLRPIGPPQVQPIDAATEPSTLPPINKYDDSALNWRQNDPLGILCSRDGVGAAVCYTSLWVGPSLPQKQGGPTYAIRGTYTATLTTSTWVATTITLDQQLPPGKYRVVGMSAICGDLIFARLVFPNQVFRPGCLAQDLDSQWDWEFFRRGNFGSWGEFESYAPPTLELMGHTAGAETGEVFIDVQPIGSVGFSV